MDIVTVPLMFIQSHWYQLIVCVVAYQAIGMLWYGMAFQKIWSRLSGMDLISEEKKKSQMFKAMGVSLLGAFVQATILGTILWSSGIASTVAALLLVLIVWIPFTFFVMATGYAYTMKSFKLLAIDSIFPLLTWLAMAAILYNWNL